MGRATDIELVIRYLMQMKAGEWIGTQAQLVRRLTETGWLQDRAERAVVRTINEDCGLHVGRGGTLKFSNADVALYSQVAQQLERWQPMKGWRVDEVLDVHAKKGLRGQGKWQYPDLLVLADPRRRLSPDDPLEMLRSRSSGVAASRCRACIKHMSRGVARTTRGSCSPPVTPTLTTGKLCAAGSLPGGTLW